MYAVKVLIQLKMCSLGLQQFRWQRLIRPLLIITYISFLFIIGPLLIINSLKDGFSKKDQLVLIGGLFLLASLPISFYQISQHVVHLNVPRLQKPIIRFVVCDMY